MSLFVHYDEHETELLRRDLERYLMYVCTGYWYLNSLH